MKCFRKDWTKFVENSERTSKTRSEPLYERQGVWIEDIETRKTQNYKGDDTEKGVIEKKKDIE